MRQSIYSALVLLTLVMVIGCTTVEMAVSAQDSDLSGKILFTSASADTGFELFTIQPDGSNLTQLTHLNNLINGFAPSPDGKHIAFRTFPDGFSTSLVLNIMRSDGSGMLELTNDTTGGIVWSPDSQQIAFISKRDGLGELYIINIDGSNKRRLTYGTTDKFMNDVYSASWSPDGKQIAFVRSSELFMINSDGTNERILLPNKQSIYGVTWSKDGQKLTFAMTESNETSIYSIRPDGTDLTKINNLPGFRSGFIWSPDEQYYIYVPKEDGIFSAFLIDVDTKDEFQISEDISGVSWSPDGKNIVYIQVSSTREKTMHIVDLTGTNIYSFTANNIYSDGSPLWVH